MRRNAPGWTWVVLVLLVCVPAGCAGRGKRPARVTVRWVAGRAAPAFDPSGPADPLRRALERLLSFGLYGRDSAGAVVPLAADTATWSDDGLTLTVRLRDGLRFTDGTPAVSGDFRAALLAGIARQDHATAAWLLAPLAGLDRIRPGRPLPPLGLEAPDPRTLVLRLASRDPSLLERLASPGLGVPFRRGPGGWEGVSGLGPYRVLPAEPGRPLTFVRADSACVLRAAVDTVAVRFAVGAPRVRMALRRLTADLAWPLPPALTAQALPAGNRLEELAASPERRLLLVFRCDVPPTTAMPARAALAHALNRGELLAALGQPAGGAGSGPWLDGAGDYDFPRPDAEATREWLSRGHLGASFHVVLAYDADGAGAEVARLLQGQWAELGLYAELLPLRSAEALAVPLRPSAAQAQLVESQAPLPGPAAELAALVMPIRGPAVGTFRTGWRTREFDPWILSAAPRPGFDPAAAQSRLAEELVALPLARLPWRWVVREGGPRVPFEASDGPVLVRKAKSDGNPVTTSPGNR